MADRDDARTEAALRDLARDFDVPPAPDVSARVRARLTAQPSSRRLSWMPRVAVAVVVALIAATVTVTVSPVARATLVELLRFAGVEIRSDGPAPSPRESATLPGSSGVTLADARRLADFPVRLPSALDRPDEVRVSGGRPPDVVSLLYHVGPGLPEPSRGKLAARLDEFAGRSAPVFEKFAAVEEDVVRVEVAGRPGIWVTGPHRVVYVDRRGEWRRESARLAANTLIWQVDRVTLRLEGHFSKAEALQVARSVTGPEKPAARDSYAQTPGGGRSPRVIPAGASCCQSLREMRGLSWSSMTGSWAAATPPASN